MTMSPQAMLKQAQKMQAKMQKVQDQAAQETVEASAGGGMVSAVVNGELKVQSITINPDALDPDDLDILQDTIVAAVNQGLQDAQSLVSKKMNAVCGGMNIPGLM